MVKLVGAAAGLVVVLVAARATGRLARARRARPPPWLALLLVGGGLAGAAVATSAMGLHYVFGAFAFGVLVAQAVARTARRRPLRLATWLGALLLPLYLVLPGATTNFRDLDLGHGGEILVVLAVAAGFEARRRRRSRRARPGCRAATRSRSACC